MPMILTDQVFGRLTVLAEYERRNRGRIYWMCECACGNRKWVSANALKVPQGRNGSTKSCGCLDREVQHVIHQAGRLAYGKISPEYCAWYAMKQRCENENHRMYLRYGGRGIKVCESWNDFSGFLADMGEKPSPKHTLERKNNDAGYSSANCVWATRAQQMRNTSRTRMFAFRGENLCLTDWASKIGITAPALRLRIAKWPLERALTELAHTECVR